MLKITLSGLLLLALNACGDRTNRTQTTTDSSATVARADTGTTTIRCFQQITGRDSTMVRLAINGSRVTGELAVLPYQKDKARGPIAGTLTDNQIRADWQRSGEGVVQPHEIIFTMNGDSLTWREGERVEKQGKWVLANPNSGFQYVLASTGCQ